MNNDDAQLEAPVPMRIVGPVKIKGPVVDGDVMVPMATFESPLWPSVDRGARVTAKAGGISIVVVDERMSRSVLLEAPDAVSGTALFSALPSYRAEMEGVVKRGSRFAQLIDLHTQIVGNLLYIRFEFKTGDASGHNMVTAASDQLLGLLLKKHPEMKYVSISGNFCTDKKPSAVNGILGRGKNVVAETLISRKLVSRFLKTTPEAVVNLNIKKNLIGTALAGGLRSANAHFANMLLGFYLATGQDAANIIEGSQGFVHAEVRDDDLYFSATLPNIIVGTVGAGKGLEFVRRNLELMGCLEDREPGENARRLAVIAAAATLCGELSLLAAQTNPGELMDAHTRLERS